MTPSRRPAPSRGRSSTPCSGAGSNGSLPDQGDRVKRLVNARLRLLFQTGLGDLPTAKAALRNVMAILDKLDEDDHPAEPDTERPASRSKKKPA